MNRKRWYPIKVLPLAKRIALVGVVSLGIFLVALLRVDAQDSSPKPSGEGGVPTKAPVKNSSADSNLVWVDSQVAWEEIRNLFAPQQATILLKQQQQQQQQLSSKVDSMTRFPTISGIISSKAGGNRAILDGMVVRPGDQLKSFLVKQITNDRVILQGEETYALVLKPHQIPSIKIFLIPASGKEAKEIVVNLASETAGQHEGKEKTPNVKP